MTRHALRPMTNLRVAIMDSGAPAYMVAARAGMSPSKLSEYSLAHRTIPPHHLIALSEILDRQPEDLVGMAEEFIVL